MVAFTTRVVYHTEQHDTRHEGDGSVTATTEPEKFSYVSFLCLEKDGIALKKKVLEMG